MLGYLANISPSQIFIRYPLFLMVNKMKIETSAQTKYNSISIRVPTTAGTMFVLIMEDENGDPVGIQLNIGKAGNELSTLAHGLARTASLALDRGASISDLIQELSGHTTDKRVTTANGSEVRSVPAGLVWALIEYGRDRYANKLRLIGDVSPRLGD